MIKSNSFIFFLSFGYIGGRSKETASARNNSEKKISASQRAGLVFPVGRVKRYLHEGGYAERISMGGAVYLAAILEYLSAEIVELAGNAARDNRKQRIIPRHILLAVKNDEELDTLLKGVVVAQGGVMPVSYCFFFFYLSKIALFFFYYYYSTSNRFFYLLKQLLKIIQDRQLTKKT